MSISPDNGDESSFEDIPENHIEEARSNEIVELML